MQPIKYKRRHKTVVDKVVKRVRDWLSQNGTSLPDLDDVMEPVYIKDSDRRITFANQIYSDYFSKGSIPIGQPTREYLDKSILEISQATDEVVLKGSPRATFEHFGYGGGPAGKFYEFLTTKVDLREFGNERYAILGVSRPVAVASSDNRKRKGSIAKKFELYDQMSDDSKRIMALIAQGLATKEIAAAFDASIRTIESRKTEMLKLFDLRNQIELAVLYVRFDERGWLSS